MVQTTITDQIAEEGSVGFTLIFTDEDGNSLVPSTLTYTLTDEYGQVVNSRTDVSVTAASSITLLLSGADLALANPQKPGRKLLLEYTYTSTLGTDIPGKHEVRFDVTELPGV